MGKKGDLLTWGVFSLLMGAVLFIMLSRVGLLFGDSTQRHDEYIIKDTALLLDQLHGLSGNAIIHTNYPVFDKVIEMSNERVSIYPLADEALKGQYTYRTIGYRDSSSIQLEEQESFDIGKDISITVNEEPFLDAFQCQKNINTIRTVRLVDDTDTLETVASLIPKLDFSPISGVSRYLSTPLPADSILVIQRDTVQNIKVYAHHANRTAQGIGCEVANELAKRSGIEHSFLVEDPRFSERAYPYHTIVWIIIPSELLDTTLVESIYTVLERHAS